MKIDKENLLDSILASLDNLQYIKVEDIPGIDLYMDQVTTLMEKKLKGSVRNPEEDKILTKTMINNYAKNNLLPPPVKKKYSREHVLMLIFIYYYKGVLSINDIQAILNPLAERYFNTEGELNLATIYETVFGLEKQEVGNLKEDITGKYELSKTIFEDAPEEDKELLQLFSFIGLLSYDVYIKKLLIEKIVDGYFTKEEKEEKKEKKEK
ncbi:MAG: DUF1836 domain-containing protein [Lachnospiraceae bacterium]|nr:DUF1836 domain-containing protein [Lachnospiraceae bacterium]